MAGRSSATAGRVAAGSGNHSAGAGSSAAQVIPRVYPLLRESTPSGLIANAEHLPGEPSLEIIGDDAGMPAQPTGVSLARVIQERFYSKGPTELLRIARQLDDQTAQLDLDPTKHDCLTSAPVARSLTFPGGQSFVVQLQCLAQNADGFLAFGFAPPPAAADGDAGPGASDSRAFYLMHGQTGGMGGAYRVHAGALEAWITVADSRAPNNSQVVVHLLTDEASHSTELTLGGSGVGFCSAHLKTGGQHLFVRGKTNAPPPPGAPNGHYCHPVRSGCFSTAMLEQDLGASAAACASIAASSFAISPELDASADPEANVAPAQIYRLFDSAPVGIASY